MSQLRLPRIGADNPEAWCRAQGLNRLAGADEAGRGPLAGPVVGAAVMLPPEVAMPGLTDSKCLSPARRESFYQRIQEVARAFAIREIGMRQIERQGIACASLHAMAQAVQALAEEPDLVLVDGPWLLPLACPQQPVIHGDARCVSIAAASVLAKVYRDQRMLAYHRLYPQYNFARHKGYATPEHLEALRRWGPCPIHRRTFRGVREWVHNDHDLDAPHPRSGR